MTVHSARASRPADRRRQLIARAADLFVQRGYPHVSMADIARAAGVTAPSLYRHFDDKQDLLGAAVLAGVDDLETCTDRALAAPASTTSDTVRALVEAICKRPDSASLWRWTGAYLSDEQNREVALRTRAVLRRWADAILGPERGLADWERSQLTWALLSVAGSSAVHKTRLSPAREVDELVARAERLLLLRPSLAPARSAGVPPTPSTTRRDEILDAASTLFAERGYADVGVDEIGAAVGISGPSVYNHFPSKAAILVGIGQRSAARLEAGVMAAYASRDDPAEILAALVDSYVTVITATPDLSVSFNNSPALAGDPSAVDLLDTQRRYVARWIDLLQQADPTVAGPAEAAVGAHAALSIVNDAVRLRRGTSRPEFTAQMAYLMKGVLTTVESHDGVTG
ncbi:putative TetR family transcriptional regulator [Gordonia araii NBRC 100433]|uniref:Putative TetR family transcriptional regulator n=1 Tax=Gordonia araii NBRC 100433 TaxID=1073574 RepID=G7H6X1_9ACTN|nr:TetR/AcrR family transcriptional regulator [Gordonia araii]NNG96013.1 TetR/AcrR family transcriptional regulator [Gordonia araii NBRC 100433]GAB11596.1 putative TetR family transcriptional regulator [Gordonia araii NBRC 100433]